MSDACVAQLVRAVDRQSKDLGSNPSAVESVFFPQMDLKFFEIEKIKFWIFRKKIYKQLRQFCLELQG